MLLKRSQCVYLWFCCSGLWPLVLSSDPLHLTPFLDARDITTALKLSEVRDTEKIIPKSYAGFITVDRNLGNHLFFWFFPAILEPHAPVLVWLNGGPSVTSMLGLLWENGPIRVSLEENGEVTYKRWQKSWAESLSMLYIDSPVGTGYSYSDSGERGWKTTSDGYTEDLFSFMNQFYIMFPEYLKQELYIGGQSYAGKYVPALAHRIHKEIQTNRSSLPLAGIYLGNPFFDPKLQMATQLYFFYSLGAVSHAQLVKHKNMVPGIFEHKCQKSGECFDLYARAHFSSEFVRDNYKTMVPSGDILVNHMMTDKRIRQTVHVGSYLPFNAFNYILMEKFEKDLFVSMKSQVAELMDNYKVLIFSGVYDGNITPVMVEEALLSTPWSLQAEYNESNRIMWRSGHVLKGFYTKVGKFCRVIVHQAGHHTPHDQPDSTREMMLQFVKYGCISY